MGSRAPAKVDPELDRQLTWAEKNGEAIEAVFMLQEEEGSLPDPERVESLLWQALKRAEQETGGKVEDVNVFSNLASFVARANPSLIRVLLEQPEVSAGTANRRPAMEADQTSKA
jgi:hypothetical protein